MALTKINDRGLTTPIDLLDNEKIRLGTGNDIELYHDGSNSIIHNKTGQTWIQGSELYLSSNHVDGQEKYLKATANGSVELYHNDAKKLETTSGGTQITGRLNIGTSTEGHASADELTLENTAADMGMTLRSGTNNQGAIYFSDGTSGDAEYRGIVLYNHANDAFSIYTSATERFRLDSTGRLSAGKAGVGSYNDASEWFKVQSNDSAANISIVGSNDTHSTLNLGDEDDFNIQKIKSDHSNNSLQFYTDNSERLRVTSGGSVNIGSTGGFDSNGDDLTITTGGHGGISIKTGTTHDGVLRFGDGSGADEYRGYINYRHAGDKFLIGTSGTQRLSVDSDGLKFGSDTAAANALDDYEEGTFTPTMVSDGSSTSMSIQVDVATYTKIGRLVYIRYQVKRTDGGTHSGTGSLVMQGLPFSGSSTQTGTFWVDHAGPTSGLGDIVGGLHNFYSTQTYFTQPTRKNNSDTQSTAASRYLQHDQWTNGRWIYGAFTYETS